MTILNPAAFVPQTETPITVQYLPEATDQPASSIPAVDELCRLLARIVTRLETAPVSMTEGGAQ